MENGVVPGIDDGNSDNCNGGFYTRTWTVTDECGNTQTHVQNITVNPTPPPIFTNIPDDETLSCADLVNDEVSVDYTNNSLGTCLIDGSVIGVPNDTPDFCGGDISYTWTIQDACGNDISETQVVTIDPPLDVEFIDVPSDITISCGDLPFTPINLNYTNNDIGACLIDGLEDTPEISGALVVCTDMIIVTWEVIDFCGRPFTANQQVTLEDLESPTFVDPPGPLTFDCLVDVPDPEDLQWEDNCDGSGLVSPTEIINATTCDGGDIQRSWEYIDNCGLPVTHTQTITINPPATVDWISTLPQDITVECNEVFDPIVDLDYSNSTGDGCEDAGTVVGVEVGDLLVCDDKIIRTWTYTPICGPLISHIQTITLEDVTAPELQDEPADIVYDCYLEIPIMEDLDWIDNCDGNGSVIGLETGSVDNCLGGTIMRTWTYTDICGTNSDTHIQTITVNPIPDIEWVVTPPSDITVNCGDAVPALEDLEYSNEPTGIDCLETGFSIPQESGELLICGDQIIRTWEVLNPACGPNLVHEQTITLEDNEDPELQNEPSDMTFECALLLPPMEDLTWIDNCDGTGAVVGVEAGTIDNCDGGTITRTWMYTDVCNNTDTYVQTITVNPVPDIDWISALPPSVVIGCGDPIPSSVDLDYSNNASDILCLASGTITPTETGELLICGDEITRTWTVLPPTCGPGLEYVQTITLEDVEPPELQDEPSDMTFECALLLPPMEDLTWIDNCDGTGTVVGVEVGTIDNCDGGTITRTWMYTDVCNNTDTHVQTITVNPIPDITWTSSLPPALIVIECNDPIPGTFNLDYSNNATDVFCLESGSIPPTETGELLICGDEIIRTWTVPAPSCGSGLEFIQTITLEDTEPPELQNEPIDLTFICITEVPILEDLTWVDNCDGTGVVTATETGTIDNCIGGVIMRTWTYTDQCNNTDSHTQSITIDPVPDIVWISSLPPSDLVIECQTPVIIPNPEDLTYSNGSLNNDCEEMGIVSPIETGELLVCGDILTRTWTTPNPDCGPPLEYVQTITLDDTTPPVFVDVPPASISLTCIGDLEDPVDLVWMDNCDDTGSVSPSQVGALDPCTGGNITRTWEYTDACGNGPTSFSQIITLMPPVATTCDDDDSCTENDMEVIDCLGTICTPCQGIITDCSGETEFLPCDDDDDCTIDDLVEVACDGSICDPCKGTVTNCLNGLTFDLPCSDGDPCTINDIRTVDCQDLECIPCAGTPTTTPDPTLNGPALICFDEAATLTASGCSGDILWYSDADGNNLVNIGPIYVTPGLTSSVTYYAACNVNGCFSNLVPILIEVATPLTTTIVGDDMICLGDITILDAGPGFIDYDWGTASTQTLTVFSSGTYTVTVTDTNGCTSTDDFLVDVIDLEDPQIGGSLSFCIDGSTTLSVDAGYADILWSPDGQTTNSIIVNSVGNYSVVVTDLVGCTASSSVNVIESTSLNPQITGSLIACIGQSNILDAGSFDSYFWSPNGETSQTIQVSATGTYEVEVSDINGCTGTSSVIVVASDVPQVVIIGEEEICDGVSYDIDAFHPDYVSYIWSTGSTNAGITITEPDEYTVTVTDLNGCTSIDELDVEFFTAAILTISGDLNICEGASSTLSAQTGYDDYIWSPNGETTSSITITTGGTYALTTTDNNGCNYSSSVNVTSSNELQVFIQGGLSYCVGSSTTLDAGLWDQYDWDPNGENSSSIIVTNPGEYTVIVTDQAGCTSSSTVEVIEDDELSPVIIGDQIICSDETGELTVIGSYDNIVWNDNSTTATISVTSGTYTVTVTDNVGCTGSSEVMVTTQTALPVSINGDLNICNGNTSTLVADSGFEMYLWSNGLTSEDIIVNTQGPYSVTVTDAVGCTSSSSVLVNVSTIDSPEISGQLEFCMGTLLELQSSGYEDYLWSTGEITSNIMVSEGGSYVLTVTDNLGCTSSSSISIIENNTPNTVILGSTSYCIGGFTQLSVQGFSSVLWSTGETSDQITVMEMGEVSVTVTDESGCTGTTMVMIQEDSELSPSISGDLIVCEEGQTSITAVGNYPSIVWSTGEVVNTISVGIGSYSVIVTDSFGCTGSSEVVVTEQVTSQVNIEGEPQFCEGSSVELNAIDGFETYIWSDGFNGQTFVAIESGNYSVTATDAAGCTSTTSFVTESIPIEIPEILGPNSFCAGEIITISSFGFASYFWSTGETTSSIDISEDGQYTVSVTDNIGCISSTSVIILENNLPEVTIVGSTSFCVGGASELSLNDDYATVVWSTGDNTSTIEVDIEGEISVVITDDNGCTGSSSVTVTIEDFLSPNIGGQLSICSGETTTLDAGTGFIMYQWSTGETTQMISVSEALDYEVTVSDSAGCTGTSSVSVSVLPNPEPTIEGLTQICYGESSILSASVEFDSYNWSTGNVTQSIEIIQGGIYNLTVTDESGCTGTSSISIEQQVAPDILFSTLCSDDMLSYNINLLTSADNVIADPYTVNYDGIMYIVEGVQISNSVELYIQSNTTDCDTILTINPPNCNCNAISDAGLDQIIDCDISSVTLGGSNTSTGDNYLYVWLDELGNEIGNESILDVMSAGQYTLEVFDINNDCSVTSSVTVLDESNEPIAIISAQPDNVIDCVIDAVVLSTAQQENVLYTWVFNKFESNDLEIIVDAEGVVTLTAIDTLTNCSNDSSLFIENQEEYPLLIIDQPDILTCITTEVLIDASSSQSSLDIVYQWYDESGPIDAEDTNLLSVSNPGSYYFEAIDTTNNCTNIDTIEVIELQNYPEAIIGDDLIYPCDVESLLISIDLLSQGNVTYNWTTENGNIIGIAQEEEIQVDSPGTYYVDIIDVLTGCLISDTLQIFPNEGPLGFNEIITQPECTELDGGEISVEVAGGGTPPFIFTLNDQQNNSGVFTGLMGGDYTIEVEDAFGCTYQTNISLDIPESVELSIENPNITLEFGESTEITLITNVPDQNIDQILWDPELAENCDNCLNISFENVTENESYIVTLIDINGCVDTTTFNFLLEQEEDVFIPNIINPNGIDNTKFYPLSGTDGVIVEEMYIYDRWGNLIYFNSKFPTNDSEFGWDATFDGVQVEAGVYVYVIQFDFPGLGNVSRVGDVTVIF